ncbi:MAG: tetratricopeptide repeat protein [Chloroflexota bacterium]
MLIGARYETDTIIGKGGMGVVYRAYDRLIGSDVALKQIHINPDDLIFNSTSAADDANQALINEFRILAGLRHPNIISVYDYGVHDAHPYFVMEYLPNYQPFKQAVQTSDEKTKIDLIRQVIEAIIYLHRRGIIHRDLKPANVLVTDKHVRVLDFGVSAIGQSVEGASGTLAYMAPETISQNITVPQSDLYALGVMIYEALVGTLPFRVHDLRGMLMEAPKLDALNESPVQDVVARLLKKDPRERFASAHDTLHAFTEAHDMPVVHTFDVRDSFLQASTFVGREEEISTLQKALTSAIDKHGSLWLVSGESGVGKTRLLDELRIRALVENALVLSGQAIEEGGLPYQLWRSAVRHLLLSTPVDNSEAGILQEIVPDIIEILNKEVIPAPRLEGQAQQLRLNLTIAKLFKRHIAPVVLILEDLQWAEESLETLQQVSRMVNNTNLLIVASYRDEERPTLHNSFPAAQRLHLNRLSSTEIQALSQSMLGEVGADPELLDLLQRETEGNVFFMVEVVRTLAEETGGLDNIGRVTLPQEVFAGGIQQLIRRRLSRIPDWADAMLNIVAISGRHLDPALLVPFADATLDDKSLGDWLQVCSNAAVLEIRGKEWYFNHDKLREGVLSGIPANERKTLHATVASIIETVYPNNDDYATLLVDHWHNAGNLEKEVHYALRASQVARQVNDFNAVGHLCNRALQQSVSDTDRLALLLELGSAYALQGEYTNADKPLREARNLAAADNNLSALAYIMVAMGMVMKEQGNYPRSARFLNQATLLHYELNTKADAALALTHLAIATERQGHYDEATAYCQQALTIYKDLSDVRNIATTYKNLGYIAVSDGQYDNAENYYNQALDLSQSIGDQLNICYILGNFGWLYIASNQRNKALNYLQQSLDLARNIHTPILEAMALINIGHVKSEEGDIDSAYTYFLDGIRVSKRIGSQRLVLETVAGIAGLQAKIGNHQVAAQWIGMARKHPAHNPDVEVIAPPIIRELTQHYPPAIIDAWQWEGESINLDAIVDMLLQTSMSPIS